WKSRARKLDTELRAFANEAVSDGRHDRLIDIANQLFELRQEILDVVHVGKEGEKATKPYPWWAREWMRMTHMLIWAELLAREERSVRIRNRLMGPDRDINLLRDPDGDEGPKRFIDRIVCWLLQTRRR